MFLTMASTKKTCTEYRPFCFDDNWISYDACRTVIYNEWTSFPCYDLPSLATKLDMYGKAMKNWSRIEVDNLQDRIIAKKRESFLFGFKVLLMIINLLRSLIARKIWPNYTIMMKSFGGNVLRIYG